MRGKVPRTRHDSKCIDHLAIAQLLYVQCSKFERLGLNSPKLQNGLSLHHRSKKTQRSGWALSADWLKCYAGFTTPKMLARDTSYIRAKALTLSPAAYLAMMSARCSEVVFDGRPSVLPSLLARAKPACVRSTSKSRSISATAPNMVSIILPAVDVRSSVPSCRTMTAILRLASNLTVAPTSCASRPRRSSFVTTNVSPLRICASSAANSGRSVALVLPLMVSAYQ